MEKAESMNLKPVAFFHTNKKSPIEAPRQGTEDHSEELGEIRFEKGMDFESALDDIDGFSHLWIFFGFHQNESWKPKVFPPRGSDTKRGVFATRSPYRPNPLGLSCVQLVRREKLVLYVSQFDLLDQTPIYDIKPYLPYADSFPNASLGWLEGIDEKRYSVVISDRAKLQFDFLKSLTELQSTITAQLSFDPLNGKRKRVKDLGNKMGIFAYKTWRVDFSISDAVVEIKNIFSGYSELELANPEDPYLDKDLHKTYRIKFS
jgi:tRNA (adenine37-N6)-methyltransferase